MFKSFIPGFFLGLSLILPIGAQNAFVLRQGLRGEHVFAICLICALSDAILIVTGVFGLGGIAKLLPQLGTIMRFGGAAFLFLYGIRSFHSALFHSGHLDPTNDKGGSLAKVALVCLALTWLNPHVYLDTVMLLGAISTQYPDATWFAAGAVTASFVFFFVLGFGARVLRPLFAKAGAWRVLDAGVGLVMWTLAVRLLIY